MKITIIHKNMKREMIDARDGIIAISPKRMKDKMRHIPLSEVSAIYVDRKKRVSSISLEPEERVLAI